MGELLSNLNVSGSLSCEFDGSRLEIKASDRKVVVEVPDVATGLKLLQLGSSRGSYRATLRLVQQLVDRSNHSLEVTMRGKTMISLGHATANRWWRLIGLPPMDIKPRLALSLLTRGR